MAESHNPELTDSGIDQRSRWFWPLAVLGWGVMAYAVWGILDHRRLTNPGGLVRLIVGLDLVHDLVLAPAVLLVGVAVTHWIPVRLRVPVKVGLVISAGVVLYAYPFVLGRGRSVAAGSSRLPNNYAFGLLVVLAAVWGVIVLTVIVRWALSRPART